MRKLSLVPKRTMKVRIPGSAGLARFFLGRTGLVLLACVSALVILAAGAFTVFYARYSRLIDEKLSAGPFGNASKIFAAPETVAVGEVSSPVEIASSLRRSG